MRSATPLKMHQIPMMVTNSSTDRSGLPIAHAPSPMLMTPEMRPIHHPWMWVCDSEIATSKIPRISRYHATKIEITTSVGPGHTIAAMPAARARTPLTIVSTRQPPRRDHRQRELRERAEPERDRDEDDCTPRSTPAATTTR